MSFQDIFDSSPASNATPGAKAYQSPDDDEPDDQAPSTAAPTEPPPTSAVDYLRQSAPSVSASQVNSAPASGADDDTSSGSDGSAASYLSRTQAATLSPAPSASSTGAPRPIPQLAAFPTYSDPASFNATTVADNPVLANALAPEIAQQRQQQVQDDHDAREAQRQQNAQMRTYSATDYLRTTTDGAGNVVPLTDPDSGKPLYHPHTSPVQYDPSTGAPFQETVDQFGSATRSDPDANAPVGPNTDDPSDPQIYRQNKHQAWQPIGHVDDLAADDSQSADVRTAAANWQVQRGAAIRKTVVQGAQNQAAQLQAQHAGVQNRLSQLGQQIDQLQPVYDPQTGAPANDIAHDAATANQTSGGLPLVGWGAQPTPDAVAAAARNSERAQRLQAFQQEQVQLADQLGTAKAPGPLTLAVQAAKLDAQITEHTIDSTNYRDMANARRSILATEGKGAEDDPILATILQKQQEFGVKATAAQQQHDAMVQQAIWAGHDLSSLYSPTLSQGSDPTSGQPAAIAQVTAYTPSAPGVPGTVQPFSSNDSPYRVGADGALSLNPLRMVKGIIGARDAGLIAADKAKQLLPMAKAAQDAAQNQQQLLDAQKAKEISAGNYAPAKAGLFGAAKGAGFLAAAAPGAAIGEEIGAPLAPFTFGLSTVAGPIIGGLITGTLGSMAVDKTARALAQHSDTIKSFTDASDLHPYYDAAGNLVSIAAGLPKMATTAAARGLSAVADAAGENTVGRTVQGVADQYSRGTGSLTDTVRNFGDQASAQAAQGASTGQLVSNIAGKVAGSAGVNVAIDTAIKEGGRMLGLSDDHQTWGGAGQAAAVGAFLAGHGVPTGDHSPRKVGDILVAGKAAVDAGQSVSTVLTPEQTGIYQQVSEAIAGKLAPTEPAATPDGSDAPTEDSARAVAVQTPAPTVRAPASLASLPPEQIAADFATRHPDAPPLHPAVVMHSHDYVPPGQEQMPEPPERADMRLAATQQIAALPDTPIPTDAAGKPTGDADPGRNRETASALFKLANGFTPDQLTATEQARLKPRGEPPLARKAPDGSTILTDTGRQQLAQSAPAAAPLITGTESQDLRRLSTAPTPEAAPEPKVKAAPVAPVPARPDFADSPADFSSPGKATTSLPASDLRQTAARTAAPAPPEPTSVRGQYALRAVRHLEAKQFEAMSYGADLTGSEKASLVSARQAMAEELAKQPPTAPPTNRTDTAPLQPTTESGKRAANTIQRLERFRTNGGLLKPGDHDTLRASHEALKADFEAQRAAATGQMPLATAASSPHLYTELGRNAQTAVDVLEGQQRELRARGEDLNSGQKNALVKARAALAQEVARPAPDDLAAGDMIQGGSRRYTVRGLGDEQHVDVTGPNGKPLRMLRNMALQGREQARAAGSPTATSEQPAAASRIEVAPQRGDSTAAVDARRWIADQREAGQPYPNPAEVSKRFTVTADRARTLVAEQAAAEQTAAVAAKAAKKQAASAPPALPVARSFRMPTAPTGSADVLDHIVEEGGMVSPTRAKASGRVDRLAGDYDGAPDLRGFYHHAVYGEGKMMPDQMAQVLHENYGVGDGSVDRMWQAIGQAKELRAKVREQQQNHALAEKLTTRFERDTGTPKAGTQAVNASTLNVGDQVKIGDQTLKVAAVDPDTLDVTLEDHTKYGVQKVADGQTLYVEQVQPRTDNRTVGAAQPGAESAEATPRAPMTPLEALRTAKAHINAFRPMLEKMGMAKEVFTQTKAASGVEFGEDGTLRINAPKLAASMDAVRDIQGRKGIASTPEDWFSQVLAHEGIHAAQNAVARSKGMSLSDYMEHSLPNEALPEGWQVAGRRAYGPEWEDLKSWQKKSEFSRMVLERGWTGRLTEALYNHLKNTVDFLRRVAGFQGADPRFRAHIEEVAARLEAAKSGTEEGETAAKAGWRTFSPESGTLGVAREDMPQIAAEHRGAMANFLQARGMGVSAQDELPGSLKPSQAEYSPAKVAKAGAIREAGTAPERRILTSADGHVIDGHHQWVDRLTNTPDDPMPTLRINAPARDILSQIHELPSAGMEKAPDMEPLAAAAPRLRSGERQGDLLSNQSEDLRLVGEQGTDHAAHQQFQDRAARESAEARVKQDEAQGTLFAAKPTDESREEGNSSVLGRIKVHLDDFRAAVEQARDQSSAKDTIKKDFDSVDTLAGVAGRQAGNNVRLDLPNDMDRQAAGAVVEAGGRRTKLTDDLARVQASPDRKLAARFAPVYQHALDHLDRLHQAAEGYRQIDLREDAATERAGFTPQWQSRAKHLYDDPTSPESTVVPDKGFGATKGFKTAADAIAAGVDPKSTDLADLTERRVRRSQQAINERAFHGGLADLKAHDGKPVLGSIEEGGSQVTAEGNPLSTLKVPKDYEAVQAGSNVLSVHKEFAPVLKALYGQSALRENPLGNMLLNVAAFAKHGTVGIGDTYHGMRTAIRALTGFQTTGYGRGLAAHEFTDADLPRAVAAGEITQAEADYAKENRATIERGLRAGLNTGKASDNLLEAAQQHNLIAHLPLVGGHLTKLNDFIFHQFQRGSMTQAYVVAEARNRARFPELNEREVARRSAKEVNEFYGNLGSQGFMASKTMQDVAKLVLFAPGFAEGGLRTEGRALGQLARVPLDLARGHGLRAGVVAQAIGGSVLSAIVANQALNLFTRGKPTWQNGDGHRWDAWIPGGPHGKGFYFSPLSIAAEYTHALTKYMGGGESGLDAAAHVVSNKLSGPARAAKDLTGGTDYQRQPFGSTGERLRAAMGDALPLPLPAGPFIQKDPKSATGYSLNHQKGALEKQLLAMAGLKVDAAPSARSQMYQLAAPFRAAAPGGTSGLTNPSPYTALRHALDNEDDASAKAEILRLSSEGGKSPEQIGHALGARPDGKVAPELFTGNLDAEHRMLPKLSAEQRQVWAQAQRDRISSARRYIQLVNQMRPELASAQKTNLAPGMAVHALRTGNRSLVNTMVQSGAIAPADIPTLKRLAKQGSSPVLAGTP